MTIGTKDCMFIGYYDVCSTRILSTLLLRTFTTYLKTSGNQVYAIYAIYTYCRHKRSRTLHASDQRVLVTSRVDTNIIIFSDMKRP